LKWLDCEMDSFKLKLRDALKNRNYIAIISFLVIYIDIIIISLYVK